MNNLLKTILFLLLLPLNSSSQENFQRLFDSKAPVVKDERSGLFRITAATTKINGVAILCSQDGLIGIRISEVGTDLRLDEKFFRLEGKWKKESAVLTYEGKTYFIVPSVSGFYLINQEDQGSYFSYSASENQRGSDIFLTGKSAYATKDYKLIKERLIVPGIQEVENATNLFEEYPDLKAQSYATKGTYAFVSEKNANYLNNYNNFFYPDNLELVYFNAEEDSREVSKSSWIQKPNLLRLESQSLGKMTIKLLFKEKECKKDNQILASTKKVVTAPLIASVASTIKVYSDKITVSITDNASADGDVVSIDLNGTTIIQNLRLEKCSATFTLELLAGDNNLCMKAVTVGNIPPNTASLTVSDAIQKKSIVLKAEENYFECVTLVR